MRKKPAIKRLQKGPAIDLIIFWRNEPKYFWDKNAALVFHCLKLKQPRIYECTYDKADWRHWQIEGNREYSTRFKFPMPRREWIAIPEIQVNERDGPDFPGSCRAA
jgi:hypothetical protein